MLQISYNKVISGLMIIAAGTLLFLYAHASKLLSHFSEAKQPVLLTAANPDLQCDASIMEVKENPNAHLFVSCGGFLE